MPEIKLVSFNSCEFATEQVGNRNLELATHWRRLEVENKGTTKHGRFVRDLYEAPKLFPACSRNKLQVTFEVYR